MKLEWRYIEASKLKISQGQFYNGSSKSQQKLVYYLAA